MKKITRMLISASLLAIAGGVSAEPMTLSTTQMDGINAGAVIIPQGAADSVAGAAALSNLLGISASATAVLVTPQAGVVRATGESGAVAVSTFNPLTPLTNGAAAASASHTTAALF